MNRGGYGFHCVYGAVLAAVLLVCPVAAQQQPAEQPWSVLLAEVAEVLKELEPAILELEARGKSMGRAERNELAQRFERVRPLEKELRARRGEAAPAELERAKGTFDLVERVIELLEDTQEFSAPEEARNAPQVERMITNLTLYGSLRARAFVDREGETTFDDATSRMGIRGRAELGKTWEFFGRYEAGTNVLSEASRFLIGGDPGTQEGREEVALPLRLAYVGFDGPPGRVSFGKQWSVYYDVGVFTDQAPFFGGVAQGTYAAGTDGGISGTGRADYALQYRFAHKDIKFGLQAQIRNETENDQSGADSYGASLRFRLNETIDLGAAYTEIRDGVAEPEKGQAKEGDRAAILGLRWSSAKDRYYAAVIYATFEQHEKDDLGRFFDGTGWEIYGDWAVTERFGLGAFWNYQQPSPDLPGAFKLDLVTIGASYDIPKNWKFYLLYKIDNGRRSDGTSIQADSLGAAVFYNFSKGFGLF